MFYKIIADLIVFIHFTWILFMLYGFALTIFATFNVYIWQGRSDKAKKFFDRWVFRTIHVCGIFYVGLLTVLREYCPLTMFENSLRSRYDRSLAYPGSFIVHYIERFVYPNIDAKLIILGTIVVAVFSLAMFVVRPPVKIRLLFK